MVFVRKDNLERRDLCVIEVMDFYKTVIESIKLMQQFNEEHGDLLYNELELLKELRKIIISCRGTNAIILCEMLRETEFECYDEKTKEVEYENGN